MMNWADVIGNAIQIYQDKGNFAYFYGAKGQVLTQAVMDALVNCEKAYFTKYSPKELEAIYEYSRGKVGLDCSGFISEITHIQNWSTGFWQDSLNKTTPVLGTWGNVLYTTHGGKGRHVGVDIGEGRFLHFPTELHSCEQGFIRAYDWEGSGQIKGISYLLAGNK